MMFKNLKTSTQISLKFTLFSAVILFIVACVVNLFFFYSWYLEARQPSFLVKIFWVYGYNEDGMNPMGNDSFMGSESQGNPRMQEENMGQGNPDFQWTFQWEWERQSDKWGENMVLDFMRGTGEQRAFNEERNERNVVENMMERNQSSEELRPIDEEFSVSWENNFEQRPVLDRYYWDVKNGNSTGEQPVFDENFYEGMPPRGSWDFRKNPRFQADEAWLESFSPEQNFPRHELRLNVSSEDAQELIERDNILSIVELDGYYLYFSKVWDQLIIRNITDQVQLQISLLWISLLVFLLWTVLSYFVSLWFVKTSLKKLNTLNEALEHLDIDHLNKKIEIEWAEDDEINKVIKVFNQSFEKIHAQTLWLKDFVRNASHELRTPLMWISTLIDVARKSKDYEWTLMEVKWEIKRMDSLLETLLLITRVEEKMMLEKERLDLIPSLRTTLMQLKEEFKDKNITVEIEFLEKLEMNVHEQWRESIMTNILRNAFKYTDENWIIRVELNDREFRVWNSWEGIDSEHLEKIWERFWQWDSSHTDSKSFWLWLYLSRLFAQKQGFDLRCESWEKGKGVTFILTF